MPLKVGDTVTARTSGKMLAREKGVPVKDKWVSWSVGSVGRVVEVKQINTSSRGVRCSAIVYLVKFIGGIAELRGIHLEGAIDDSLTLRKSVMDIVDPDTMVHEVDLEGEPDYS